MDVKIETKDDAHVGDGWVFVLTGVGVFLGRADAPCAFWSGELVSLSPVYAVKVGVQVVDNGGRPAQQVIREIMPVLLQPGIASMRVKPDGVVDVAQLSETERADLQKQVDQAERIRLEMRAAMGGLALSASLGGMVRP
jgi:hypothetical protein